MSIFRLEFFFEWPKEKHALPSDDFTTTYFNFVFQDQDSLGGLFDETQSFSGNVTSMSIWRAALSAEDIAVMANCTSLAQQVMSGTYLLSSTVIHTYYITVWLT